MTQTDLDRALANLRNILSLEEKRGYNNRAVLGGLEMYVNKTLIPAVGTEMSSQQAHLIRGVAERLNGYGLAESRDRAQKVSATKKLIEDGSEYLKQTETLARKHADVKIAHGPTRVVPGLDEPIERVHTVGAKRAQLYQKLGIYKVRDALTYYPKDYHDRSRLHAIDELQYNTKDTFIATVKDVSVRRLQSNTNMLTAILSDATGTIEATWFTRGFVRADLEPGAEMIFTGKIGQYRGRLKVESPEYERLDSDLLHSGRIVPIYRLTEGLSGRLLRRVLHDVVAYHAPDLHDDLPSWVRDEASLMDLSQATYAIHFPTSWDDLERARRRLGFEEILELQLGALMKQASRRRQRGGIAIPREDGLVRSFMEGLPFRPTGAQERVITQILGDMASRTPMRRLLQGDVGSGKTLVAAAALLVASASGHQGALMAPTEILAEQHYNGLTSLYESLGPDAPKVTRLTGSTPQREKREIYSAIANGDIQVVVGTHAVIQEAVEFKSLAIAVVDEQHRFGVEQRSALQSKGASPHLLVMTATPIPRSLALTVYGDLDVSVLDEMPPGRQTIKTYAVPPEQRGWAYSFLHDEIRAGHQAFIICPLVEESEKVEARAATAEYERLQRDVFPDLRLGLLHGRMKAQEKDATMDKFRDYDLDVLVSTSVVEVGIDVPNATVMLVEGADRFGLSQLHQFRGRVGRGSEQSYCLLLADSPGEDGRKRLEIVAESTDGFYLAEQDLLMRGPGEFFGVRQSGAMDLKVASIADVGLIEETRAMARRILADDPTLESYPGLASRVVTRMVRIAEAN